MNKIQVIEALKKLNDVKLNNIIDQLQRDLLIETSATSTSSKTRIKYCLNYSKKLEKTSRPIFSKCIIENDIQYFTDSFFAVALSSDFLPLPEAAKEENYPNIKKWFDNPAFTITNDFILVNAGKLLNALKIYNHVIIKNDCIKCLLSYDVFKNMIMFLNVNLKDDIVIRYTNGSMGIYNNMLYIQYKNNKAVMVPCKIGGGVYYEYD